MPKLTDIEVSFSCATAPPGKLAPISWQSWEPALLAPYATRSARSGYTVTEPRLDHAIGLQVWLDIPRDTPGGVRDPDVWSQVEGIVDWLGVLAAVRHPGEQERIDEELAELLTWARRLPVNVPELTDLDIDAHSHDDDFRVRTKGRAAVFVASRAPDGTHCPGIFLRFAVGPDRFGLRVQARPERRIRGRALLPNTAMGFGSYEALQALESAVGALEALAVTHEAEVHNTVARPTPAEVTELLSAHGRLFAAHSRLAARQASFVRRADRLTKSGRDEAVSIDDRDLDTLAALGQRLDEAGGRINDAPQFLVTASSFAMAVESSEQGERTEFLTKWAATLVAPTLVAGLFGANVLPDTRKTGWAFLGLGLVMLASALATYIVVEWRNAKTDAGKRAKARGRGWWRAWAAGLAAIVGAGLMILCETPQATEAASPTESVERVVTVPQLLPLDLPTRGG